MEYVDGDSSTPEAMCASLVGLLDFASECDILLGKMDLIAKAIKKTMQKVSELNPGVLVEHLPMRLSVEDKYIRYNLNSILVHFMRLVLFF